MKITINGNITPDTIDSYLTKQKQKTEKIKSFCKSNNINELVYKDSELEYEYKQDVQKPKVETRPKQTQKEVRGG